MLGRQLATTPQYDLYQDALYNQQLTMVNWYTSKLLYELDKH